MAESGRRTFGPVVLLGLAAAGISAVAATRQWLTAQSTDTVECPSPCVGLSLADGAQVPLASALALVVLAGWGVVLVTRGRVRRATTVLVAIASVGLAACVGYGRANLRAAYEQEVNDLGRTMPDLAWTPWIWVAAVGAVVSIVASVAAVRLVGGWPEMGSKYDAPSDRPRQAASDAHADESQDLWKAIDEGRDPTA